MKRRAKKLSQSDVLPIEVRAGDATMTVDAQAVRPMRSMLSRLTCAAPLPKCLAVVAALREEGATRIALTLAATWAADTPASLCVVELNWHWPGLLGPFASEKPADPAPKPAPGLAAVLGGEKMLGDVLLKTSLPNLALLPAGELPNEQRAIAARGEALRNVIHTLSEQFDHLVIDVPAVLATSDAIPLASLADGCVLVVRQGVTPVSLVKQALDQLSHLRVLGVMLNRERIRTPRWLRRLIPQE